MCGYFFMISGGPDSMLSFYLIYNYLNGVKFSGFEKMYEKLSLQKGDIYILHYNHKIRKESDEEAEFLRKYFLGYNFIYGENTDLVYKEHILRKKRRDWVKEVVSKFDYKNKYIITGHNLTDRIETTFLNLLRGSFINGFINMKFLEEKDNYIILRPLIFYDKDFIQQKVKEFNIPFFIDKTNFDETISKRNKIRKILKTMLTLENKKGIFYNSFIEIYDYLEKILDDSIIFKKVFENFYQRLGVDWIYVTLVKTENDIINIFKKLNIYYDIDKDVINEFYNFFIRGTGYKIYKGIYFFKSSLIYIMNKYPNFGYTGEVIKKNGIIVRYPKKGDKYKNKSISRYLSKLHVPIFIRGWIKVIEKNGIINLDLSELKELDYIHQLLKKK